jgi:hypothetical protein
MKLDVFNHAEFSSFHAEQARAAFQSTVRGRSDPEAANRELSVVTADVRVKLSCCAEDQVAADQLVAMRYASRGYRMNPETEKPPRDRGSLSNCLTLLACRGEQAVGTLTIGLDTRSRLLVDQHYGEIVDGLRRAGRRVVELRRLAVRDPVDGKAVLAHLFRALYCMGRVVRGPTDVLVEVNPRHAPFYTRVFGFVRLGDECTCTRVNAPAVLMRLDLADLEQRLVHLRHYHPFHLATA